MSTTRIRDFEMKKRVYKVVVILFIILISTIICYKVRLPINGNGTLVTSEKTVSTFKNISFAGFVDVRFHISEIYRVVITVDEKLDEFIEIFTYKNVLNIGTKRGQKYKFTDFLVDVYNPILMPDSMYGLVVL